MASRIEMVRYYREYQKAVTKSDRARTDLNRLKQALLNAPDAETAKNLTVQIEEAQAAFDKAKQAERDAWYLSTTGRPREEVTAPMKLHDPLGFKNWW